MAKRLARGVSLVGLLFLPACTGKILFQSNFDSMPEEQPPAAAQQVGTASTHGSVVVILPPVTPSGRWVKIDRPSADSDIAGFQGNFPAMGGEGEYTFSTTVFMPTGAGVATIQFERFGQPVSDVASFLHLDLMSDNKVRIDDDDGSKFGSFPRNQPFVVQVTLVITPASTTAHVVLSGAGASGTADRTVPAPLHSSMARQFGAIRLWMGFPHTGHFDATNIVVRRKAD
jgi:hypothetical protein